MQKWVEAEKPLIHSRRQFLSRIALKDKQHKGFVQALGFIFFAPAEHLDVKFYQFSKTANARCLQNHFQIVYLFFSILAFPCYWKNIILSKRIRNGFLLHVRKTRRANVSSSWRKRRFVLQLSRDIFIIEHGEGVWVVGLRAKRQLNLAPPLSNG